MAWNRSKYSLVYLIIALFFAAPFAAAAYDRGGSTETLKQYVAELRKKPDSVELREKVIKYAQDMKHKPPVPEEYERQMARGGAFFKLAADPAGFQKAADEYKAAVAAAPWLAEGYEELANAQEKAGLYAEAIQNLNFSLLAEPNGKNSREIRNRVYELEVFAEEAKQKLKTSPAVPPPAPPAPPVVAKQAPSKKSAPAAKRIDPKAFVGNWFFKTTRTGGSEYTINAFTITLNEKGELAAQAPRKATGATTSITAFEVSNDGLHVQVTSKQPGLPSYLRTDDYDVTLKDDGKLKGSWKLRSSGNDYADEVTLFKQ
jgi:tetratricopeptide (TPR) repeat protein